MNDKRITILDVAKKANVSVTTVSFVMNGIGGISSRTKERVNEAIERLNYVPNKLAQRFASGKSKTILFVVPPYKNIFIDPYFGNGLDGVYEAAEKRGYMVSIFSFNEEFHRKKAYLELFQTNQIEGMIIMGTALKDEYLLELTRNNYQIILVNSFLQKGEIDFVASNDFDVGYCATEYLIKLGHKKIGYINGPEDDISAIERLNGYKLAKKKYGITDNGKLIYPGDFLINSGVKGVKKLMSIKKPPSAIFCVNDMVAFGAIKNAKSLNINIPEQLSIIGVDDNPVALLSSPKITTFRQSSYKLCSRAVNILIDRLEGKIKKNQVKITVPMKFIERESCARNRN